jgi:hypothetical protein
MVTEARRVYQRQYYLANREVHLAKSKARYDANPAAKAQRAEVRRQLLRAFIRQQKEGKCCLRCGFSDSRALDIHHRDGTTKETTLAQALHRAWSIKRMAREIAKCDLLCANCHRILHAERWEDR